MSASVTTVSRQIRSSASIGRVLNCPLELGGITTRSGLILECRTYTFLFLYLYFIVILAGADFLLYLRESKIDPGEF
jgi:hypothetical protein